VTAVAAAASNLDAERTGLAEAFVGWLTDGVRPARLFADDVFCDLSVPHWRVQAEGADAVFAVREDDHRTDGPGEVRVEALDATSRGFLIQFEERWESAGQRWYCRELIHCIIRDGLISELSVSCTGDWDVALQRTHAAEVALLRP
jgi:hypothetical protein